MSRIWIAEKRTRLAYCHCQFARRGIWIDGFPDSIDSFLKRNRTKEPAIYREKKIMKSLTGRKVHAKVIKSLRAMVL